jgi:2'-hydroxyisoflavone reductase
MPSRREFLVSAAGAALSVPAIRGTASALTPKSPAQRWLIIGGTSFVGPAIVEEAMRRGVHITLFNRGKTNPGLFPDIEKIHGDRNADVPTLTGLFADKNFDSVIDTSGYFPRQIRNLTAALKGRAKHYVFVSSVSAYKDMSVPLHEDSPLATLADPTVEKITEGSYGGLKVLCEQAAQAAFPGAALVVRPGYIVGPRDPTDRFTSWPLRVRRGGEMLAPGSESDPIQVIDVRDLGNWMVAMTLARESGVYNAVGPGDKLTIGELLATCKRVTKSDARPVWISADKLKQAGVIDNVPIWVPPSEIGMAQVSHARARKKGMTFRPLQTTITDTLAWWDTLPPERQAKVRAGLKPEQEAAALKLK